MSEKSRALRSYKLGCALTDELVSRFKTLACGLPEFVMPDEEIALIASLADVGRNLCRNDAARMLVAGLLMEAKRRDYPDYPTVLMLRACLDHHEIPYKVVPFEDLGLKGDFIPMSKGYKA